jgi:hypothetical protein
LPRKSSSACWSARPGRVALVEVHGEGLEDDLFEVAGEAGAHLAGRGDAGLGDVLDGLDVGVALEEARADGQLIQERPQREDVRAVIDLQAVALLGGHVGVLALELPVAGGDDLVGGLGDPEVQDLHDPVEGDDDVLRGDVAVDDAHGGAVAVHLVVRVVEPGGGVGDDADGVAQREEVADGEAALGDLAQVLAVDVLHGDEVLAVALAQVEDLDNVRVVEGRGDAGLVEEHLDELVIVGVDGEDALDDELFAEALHPLLARQEDLRHAARGEPPDEAILSKLHQARPPEPQCGRCALSGADQICPVPSAARSITARRR